MSRHGETLTEHITSIALGARLVLGLVVGSAVMALGSLYTVVAMAVARRVWGVTSPTSA